MRQHADTDTEATTSTVAGGLPAVPDEAHRWRCGSCGNITRFDVVRAARTREYWHLDLSGAPTVEETVVVSEQLASVTCRWCGRADEIEVVRRPGVEPDA